mmetsp:Transcript_14457/g.36549  ORF Transcript_14457/g.36549 Transcript_14457/m.36549 type:complete len:606 (-) Transcript_14457:717-2534(-)
MIAKGLHRELELRKPEVNNARTACISHMHHEVHGAVAVSNHTALVSSCTLVLEPGPRRGSGSGSIVVSLAGCQPLHGDLAPALTWHGEAHGPGGCIVVYVDVAHVIGEGLRAEWRHLDRPEAELDAVADKVEHHGRDRGVLEVMARAVLHRTAIALVTLMQPRPAVHVSDQWVQEKVVEGGLVSVALPSQGVEPTDAAHGAPRIADVAARRVVLAIVELGHEGCPAMNAPPTVDASQHTFCPLRGRDAVREGDEVRVVVHEVPARSVGVQLRYVVVLGAIAPQHGIGGLGHHGSDISQMRGPRDIANGFLRIGEVLKKAYSHGVRVGREVIADKDVDHQRAWRLQKPELWVDHLEEECAGVSKPWHVAPEPLDVASQLGVVEATEDPEHIWSSLGLPAESLIRRHDTDEVVRQLTLVVHVGPVSLQHRADLFLEVWITREKHGGSGEIVVGIEKVVVIFIAVVGPGDGRGHLADSLSLHNPIVVCAQLSHRTAIDSRQHRLQIPVCDIFGGHVAKGSLRREVEVIRGNLIGDLPRESLRQLHSTDPCPTIAPHVLLWQVAREDLLEAAEAGRTSPVAVQQDDSCRGVDASAYGHRRVARGVQVFA